MSQDYVLINGKAYEQWTDFTVDVDFETVANKGSVTASFEGGQPASVGDTVQIYHGGRPVLTGHIKTVSTDDDYGQHVIVYECRDKTQDFVDSTVGPKVEFKTPISLKAVLEGTLKAMDLDIKVIDKAQVEDFTKSEVINAGIDARGFGFVEGFAQKRKAFLTTDGKGNIVIARNDGEDAGFKAWRGKEDDPRNNILRASSRNTDEGRHNTVMVAAQKSPTSKDYWESKAKTDADAQADAVSKNWAIAVDEEIRPERRLHFRAGSSSEGESPKEEAEWHSNVQRARGFEYNATFQGSLSIFPGVIIEAHDEHHNISQKLFVKTMQFQSSYGGGSTTSLGCTHEDAYTTKVTGKANKRGAKSGVGSPKPGTHQSSIKTQEDITG